MGSRVTNVTDLPRLIRGLLDANYERLVSDVLRAVASSKTTGLMNVRMNQLYAEMQRLEEAGEKLTIDNPVLAAWFSTFEDTLQADMARVDSIADQLQMGGIDVAARLTPQITFSGLNTPLRGLWNVPDPEAVASAVDFANKPAWARELGKVRTGVAQAARNVAVRGIVRGQSPLRTAADLRRVATDLSVAQARTISRTLYLSSYRQSVGINQLENANFLVGQIRIAVLDARTCMSCVIQNGDLLPVGEVVKDHHNGRCTSVAVVRGYPRNILAGGLWFETRPEAQQRAMMGEQAFDDWKTGKIELRDFIQPYKDDVFGEMTRQASLKEIYLKRAS